jgi:NAD(P)H-flavin reductase
MEQIEALATAVEQTDPFVRVALRAPEVAQALSPGRFVLANLGDYLRTPLFPTRLGAKGFEVLVPPDHAAAAPQHRDSVDLIGPLGRGFEVGVETRRLLLVADTAHLPVLLQTSGVSETPGVSIALLLSAPTAAELYPIQLLPLALEVHIVTADGSAGHGGSALDLFPDLLRWADCICAACDPATYPAMAELVREVRMAPCERTGVGAAGRLRWCSRYTECFGPTSRWCCCRSGG